MVESMDGLAQLAFLVALVLAVIGVGLLLAVAQRSQAPVIEIGHLQGTMNWAYVGLEGVVSRQPSLDAESGTLQF